MRGAGDPLLGVTRLLLRAAVVLFAAAALAALMALVPAWFFREHVLAWLVAHSENHAVGSGALLAVSAILLGFAAVQSLSIQFLRKLIAIIDTVGDGSPFIARNADRLRAMGWISLIVQGLALLAIPFTAWLRHVFGSHHIFVPFSLGGLVMGLLLFILARVFEQGARLAEDVEGTV